MDGYIEGDANADVVPFLQGGRAIVLRRHGIGEVLLLPSVEVRSLCVEFASVGDEIVPWVRGVALSEAVCGLFGVDGIAIRLVCVMAEVR